MSEFHVTVVRLGEIRPLENSDHLAITEVYGSGGYPCIVKREDFRPGDLAVYIPVDSVVSDHPRFAFLDGHKRIKARRLRGTFSMGLLLPAESGMQQGADVAEAWGITKYEPTEHGSMRGPCVADEADPGLMPVYTDIEGLRRWAGVLSDGEEVVITEKIHGENFRAVHDGSRLWVASRTRFKLDDPGSKWWQAAHRLKLGEVLRGAPLIGIYGESHGYTGGFAYASKGAAMLRVFDAMNVKTRRYMDFDDFVAFCGVHNLPMAPVLYRGPWSNDLRALANGKSTIDPSHVREGIVVRPVLDRWDPKLGRVILKLHGEEFLLKAGKGQA